MECHPERSTDFTKSSPCGVEGPLLETLLRSKELVIERAEIVWQALRKFHASRADFADCLIERSGHAVECQYTVTFDRNAAGAAGMKLLR